jgi:cytochrome c oxidase cbb3-type subunit 3
MSYADPERTPTPRRAAPLFVAIGLVVLAALSGGAYALDRLHQNALGARLLATLPDEVDKHPDLVRYADGEARPLFASHCSGCHGLDLKGRGIGAPDLTDSIWLYGSGVFHIERTILYGVRSGQKKANDITEMPAFGQRGQLSDADIKNVVQYLLQLNHRPCNDQAAFLGRQVYQTKGQCFDCHAADAKGVIDYGAPDLTANVWDFGGSPQALYDSIYYGRHGIMPAWIGRLTPEQIRALAVYVDTASRR